MYNTLFGEIKMIFSKFLTPQIAKDYVQINCNQPNVVDTRNMYKAYCNYVDHYMFPALKSQCINLNYFWDMICQVVIPFVPRDDFSRVTHHLRNTVNALGGYMQVNYYDWNGYQGNTLSITIINPFSPHLSDIFNPIMIDKLTLNEITF